MHRQHRPKNLNRTKVPRKYNVVHSHDVRKIRTFYKVTYLHGTGLFNRIRTRNLNRYLLYISTISSHKRFLDTVKTSQERFCVCLVDSLFGLCIQCVLRRISQKGNRNLLSKFSVDLI